MKRAAQFASDTSLDAIQFCARAQAANAVHRNVCLKHWKVDTISKKNLSIEKFVGRMLFGEHSLEKVLVETKEEKKAMPSTSTGKDKDPKSKSSQSFRSYKSGGEIWGEQGQRALSLQHSVQIST